MSNSKTSWQRGVSKWRTIPTEPNLFNSDHAKFSDIPKEVKEEAEAVDDPTSNLRVMVGTWNVGGKAPRDDQGGLNLWEWLLSSSPHIYVLGFQEIVPLNAANVLGAQDAGPAATWLSLIQQALNEGARGSRHEYSMVGSKQMVGVLMCLWVRSDLCPRVAGLSLSCVGRGLMGRLGNKGSVAMSMTLDHTSFCFVCTHLASGERDGDELRRNLDVSEILKRTRFSRSQSGPRTILGHDKVIWLGDLNYRLANISGIGDTLGLIKKRDWKALLDRDQLRREQGDGRVFQGWEEGNIDFAPTYKYLTDSDRYYVSQNSLKQRTPAWCDRILWRGEGMKQERYGRGESKFSDHRPVSALFHVRMCSRSSLAHPLRKNALTSPRVQAEELLPPIAGLDRLMPPLTTT